MSIEGRPKKKKKKHFSEKKKKFGTASGTIKTPDNLNSTIKVAQQDRDHDCIKRMHHIYADLEQLCRQVTNNSSFSAKLFQQLTKCRGKTCSSPSQTTEAGSEGPFWHPSSKSRPWWTATGKAVHLERSTFLGGRTLPDSASLTAGVFISEDSCGLRKSRPRLWGDCGTLVKNLDF